MYLYIDIKLEQLKLSGVRFELRILKYISFLKQVRIHSTILGQLNKFARRFKIVRWPKLADFSSGSKECY